jgi:hypothetical protein
MKTIYPLLLLVLCGCARTTEQSVSDSTSQVIDTLAADPAATSYTNNDSDSLLISDTAFEGTVVGYTTNGEAVGGKSFGGGECWGSYTRFSQQGVVLTIEKVSCGEYGSSNSQFLTRGDSLIGARKCMLEWLSDSAGATYRVVEKIYAFKPGQLTIAEKSGSVSGAPLHDLSDVAFQSTTTGGKQDYENLKMELEELLTTGIILE